MINTHVVFTPSRFAKDLFQRELVDLPIGVSVERPSVITRYETREGASPKVIATASSIMIKRVVCETPHALVFVLGLEGTQHGEPKRFVLSPGESLEIGRFYISSEFGHVSVRLCAEEEETG